MVEPKTLITDYLRTLSGEPKTPELIGKYVDDPRLKEHIADVEAAFPCYEIVAEDLIAEGNKVVVRGTFSGVHQGPFAGVEARGKRVSAGLIIIYAIRNGRIADHWMQFDFSSLLEQLRAPSLARS